MRWLLDLSWHRTCGVSKVVACEDSVWLTGIKKGIILLVEDICKQCKILTIVARTTENAKNESSPSDMSGVNRPYLQLTVNPTSQS